MDGPERRDDSSRLVAFEKRVERPRQILALFWLPLLVTSRAVTEPAGLVFVLELASNLIWSFFLVEYILRLRLASRTGNYFREHLFDVAALMFPPLRVLWAFRGFRTILRQPGLVFFLACTVAVVTTAALLVYVIERNATDANIDSLGDAIWWAFVTATTVGYGDHTPVSGIGRLLAGGLMLAGVVLYSVVTAHIAAYVIDRSRSEVETSMVHRLDEIASRISSIEQRLASRSYGSSRSEQHP